MRNILSNCFESLVEKGVNEKLFIFGRSIAVIFVGCGMYAACFGVWRSPVQALYVAVKFPLVIVLTVFVNSLINWMFSQVIGFKVSFSDSLYFILSCFSLFSVILFSFVPVAIFIFFNLPSVNSKSCEEVVGILTVFNVFFVGMSGVIANLKLYYFLSKSLKRAVALKLLFLWLFINLFLGAQLSWNLRPFLGSPFLEVEFLRADALNGSFYEDLFGKIKKIVIN